MTQMPSRILLKNWARWRMAQALGACLTLSAVLVALMAVTSVFQISSGGTIPLYLWNTAEQTIQTGASLGPDGFFAALRIDAVGVGLSVAITPQVAAALVITQLLITAVVAPFKLGAMENLYTLARGSVSPFRAALQWYLDLRRAGSAILTELVLFLCWAVLCLLLSLPGLTLLWSSNGDLDRMSAASWLILAALFLAHCVMTQLVLARCQLARSPLAGPLAAFRETFRILKGRRGQYLIFRLSFLVLEFINQLTRGLFNLYLFPYQNLSDFLWLEAAEGRTPDMTVPPVPLAGGKHV